MAAPTGLLDLPPEVIQIMLSYLPDASSLLSAILASSSLKAAYQALAMKLSTQVVLNCIGLEVLPEAWINFQLLKPAANYNDHIARAEDLLLRRQQPALRFCMPEASKLCRIHSLVDKFAKKYSAHAFATPLGVHESDNAPGNSPHKPSTREYYRVLRAFYRFEMFCHLHRSLDDFVEEGWRVFFSKFALWENEQLACVYDHLFRIVTPAYNDLADHDILWGELRADHAYAYDSGDVQHHMSRGLAYIDGVASADTFEERNNVMTYGGAYFGWAFIYEPIRSRIDYPNELELQTWSPAQYAEYISGQGSFYEDPDKGPEEAWKWGAQSEKHYNFVLAAPQLLLRKQGYVFYDVARLEASSKYHARWQAPPLDAEEFGAEMSREERGFRRRAEIWLCRGRGWWSLHDESKVEYLPGCSAPPKGKYFLPPWMD